ncbi:MAG: hypothetical protein GWN76_14635 [candidate division Zixibacteria bacterium]|nr:hypothetical protein [candidate division Zixibacteria bacterium]NIR65378.1 hypothetical protein [candidate division Zixibacteria bacterium]NIS47072.1 hypothetical protein [candidate division Zixibacteria bacterium]NIU15208.1 hypothetical protein [candidate division Zixibacteria bacterium]
MADQEMYDYLPGTASADYTATTFAVSPQRVLREPGRFPGQKRHKSDGNTYLTTTRNDTPRFRVILVFASVTSADAGTIIDFFYDTAKAKGLARSFQWDHPTDGHTYIVKFDMQDMDRLIRNFDHGFGTLRLVVVDRVND